MKIAMPVMYVSENLECRLCDHFGSAPYFAVFDTDTEELTVIANSNEEHVHGACNPLAVLANSKVNSVIVRGIGGGAVARLKEALIPVFRTSAETVEGALEEMRADRLMAMTDGTCSGHGGGCH